jgi:very-short-patch-repair endonuclease
MTKYYGRNRICSDCNERLEQKVYDYSILHFRIPLCRTCQHASKRPAEKATPQARELYYALKKRGVPAELEKHDGYKTIDIAVTDAMVNIEVDGGQHINNAKQALADLQRTLHSFKKGWLTLRVPNCLIENHLEDAADHITEFLQESADGIEEEWDEDE